MNNKENEIKTTKKPWPTKEAMEQVYTMKLWGDTHAAFYSGIGSHQSEIVDPYIEAVSSFLSSFKSSLVVCDLGCGDFNVGKELVQHTKKYIAVDIVTDLIVHNKKVFQEENLEFHCIDIALDDLPAGDCAILRQVLQHLSNAEIQCILNKLTQYKYVIVTEHLPAGDFTPNKDIISGQGTRLKKQSGLDLLAASFTFEVKEAKEITTVVLDDGTGVIMTTMYRLF